MTGGTYTPASAGLGKYFFAMLDDGDRNRQYAHAIQRCIAAFKTEQGRAPRVLDVGVGTGLLSALCLLHGCEHVTGVDTNESMVSLAGHHLKELDPRCRRHRVRHVLPNKPPPADMGVFDMVVSEILGTLATSESMHKYLSVYGAHIATFGDGEKVYMVPQRTEQCLAVHAFKRDDLGFALHTLLEHGLAECGGRYLPTNEGGAGLHLHLYPSRRLGARVAFHVEHYDRLLGAEAAEGGAGSARAGARYFATEHVEKEVFDLSAAAPDELLVGVLEWEVLLWGGGAAGASDGGVWLRNTLEEYRAWEAARGLAGVRNGVARGSAWGFFVVHVPRGGPSLHATFLRMNKNMSIPSMYLGNAPGENRTTDPSPTPLPGPAAPYPRRTSFS